MFDRGKETTIQALGKTWTFARMGWAALDKFLAWVKTQEGDPFEGLERILPTLPKEQADALLSAAIAKRDALIHLDFTSPLIYRWLFGANDQEPCVRGIAQMMMILAQKHHPGFDIDTAGDILEEIGVVAAKTVVKAAAGSMEKNGEAPARSEESSAQPV